MGASDDLEGKATHFYWFLHTNNKGAKMSRTSHSDTQLLCTLLCLIFINSFFHFRWSFGCLLAEVLSGTKMFSATDKMASVLRPHQLLEMRMGTTEMRYEESGLLAFYKDAKDLIIK